MSIIDLETIERKELIPGFKVRFVHSDKMTIAYWDIKAGSSLPKHAHIHEQIAQVAEGKFELTIEDNTFLLKEGMVAVIPSNAEHSGRAVSDCKMIDTFYPVREDFL
jgi:quercetin dioxygenase-like cupin family protein